MLSPGFRSAAEMAGWDEEALLVASQVVEDTPIRDSCRNKRFPRSTPNSAASNSNGKRRSRRQSLNSLPVVVLRLDDEEKAVQKDAGANRKGGGKEEKDEKKEEVSAEKSSGNRLPNMDRLREELSCAICLDICYEPSTTPCGHSFCKKCLKSASSKCGRKCPKCRQLISNGRSCTVNTVLWNTIQLLFPDEVEVRKKATIDAASPASETEINRSANSERFGGTNTTASNARAATQVAVTRGSSRIRSRRRVLPSQFQDAALAMRLQREEFMEAFQEADNNPRDVSIHNARSSLRAMASRAVHFHSRRRFPYIID